jgi:tetratricopeptide (TPR) repeat protein
MGMPELTPVESSRFQAWHYDQRACELYVQYPPSKKQPHGVTCIYSGVAPEIYDEGLEAPSKGSWLYEEIISKPVTYPFRVIEMPATGESRQEFENDRMGQTGADNAEKMKTAQPPHNLVPEPIRAIAILPEAPVVVMPEILPPDVREGEKPFAQVVRERALDVAAAVPLSLRVSSAEAYKALGSALVVIQTERRAVSNALDTIARPMIEAKRTFDTWRNEVLTRYDEAEKRLNSALQSFKRAEEARVREEETQRRRENEYRARRQAEEAAEARRKAQAEEANRMAESARQRMAEAQATIATAATQPSDTAQPVGLFGPVAIQGPGTVAEAEQEIIRAQADLQQADVLAKTPIEISPFFVAPAVVAKPDLKVTGLRNKPPLWRWRILPRFFRSPEIASLSPIRRTALLNPSEIPDEYWVLDEKAISAHVKSMDGVISIPQVEAYDANKS